MPPIPVRTPANFTPTVAVSFSDTNGDTSPVRNDTPLPVAPVPIAAGPALSGSSAVTGTFGPFVAVAGRPIVLALSGSWTGSVRILRSTDTGTTKLPLTVAGSPWAQYTANCCEAFWEESDAAAQLYLEATLSAGTLVYRIAQ